MGGAGRTSAGAPDAADPAAPSAAAASRPVPPETPRENVLRGILLILASISLFSCSDALSKYLRATLPVVEIVWIRYAVFVAITLLLLGRGRFRGMRAQRRGLQVMRGLCVVGSALFFVVGLGYLPLAEATAINYVAPTFITLLSIPVLGEVVGIRRWAALLVGFAGVLIVVQPGSSAFQPAAVFPLLTAIAWAGAVVITRRIGTADRAVTTMFWTAGTGLAVLTLMLPFSFRMPTAFELGLALAHGVLGSVGQMLVVQAYRHAGASVLAPFSYGQIVTSGLVGFLVFGSVPGSAMLLGSAVIIASGLYTAHRERVRARERR
ncbi:DMT family transporter [Roseomonas sp. NAR14]|uniref:DMT family transporter n=1 Tax=Roseomonas acroporae TaxID=2937791 RepID=A0A9X2BX21_9PROT|nr:DMT family transporter [Roseomonas acroporae]MCK8785489.1 DMT family transporter [Roseomonas acroporae]